MPLPIFNNQAHDIIVRILDEAEERFIAEGTTTCEMAGDYLTELYIDHCVSMIRGGSIYLESEEMNGASYFFDKTC